MNRHRLYCLAAGAAFALAAHSAAAALQDEAAPKIKVVKPADPDTPPVAVVEAPDPNAPKVVVVPSAPPY